jgi:hypothetical protein
MRTMWKTTLVYSTETGRICPDCSEPAAQKVHLVANKNAATAAKKMAAHLIPTGANSLFDFDDDLDALGAVSGGEK